MKTLKTLIAVSLVSLIAGSSLFAASKTSEKINDTSVTSSIDKSMTTICGKIKSTKNGYKIEAKNGKSYIIDILPSSDVPSVIFRNRKNKLMIISGYANDETGVFVVEKIGGMNETVSDK